MKKLKRIFAILLAVTLIVPQLPAMKTSASDSDVNLALNKTVVASNEAETPGSNAVDGNLSTRWTTWPNGPSQSLTVDLESVSTINKFVIYNEEKDTQKIKKFSIWGSNDGNSFFNIYSGENADGFDLGYEVIMATSCKCRYVKIVIEELINGAVASVSLREFQVWGTAGGEVAVYEYEQFNPTTTVDGSEVYVLAQNATANSEQYPAKWTNDGPAEWAFDGNDTHWWHSRYDWGTEDEPTLGTGDVNDVITSNQKATMFTNGNTLWIGSGFDQSILLGKITYQGRDGSQGLIGGYNLYVANLNDPTATPTNEDFELVQTGTLTQTGAEQEIVLITPKYATHFRLEATSFGGDTYYDSKTIAAKTIKVYTATEILEASDFLGGSLRKSLAEVDADGNIIADTAYENYAKTSIRFGYKIYELEGYTLKSWEWKWGLSEDNLAKTVLGTNKLPAAGEEGVYTSNLVIQNVPVQSYETNIYSKLIVTYTNAATGEDVVVDTGIVSRSVYEVATMAVEEPKEEGDDEYGQAILDAYTAYLGTITQ